MNHEEEQEAQEAADGDNEAEKSKQEKLHWADMLDGLEGIYWLLRGLYWLFRALGSALRHFVEWLI